MGKIHGYSENISETSHIAQIGDTPQKSKSKRSGRSNRDLGSGSRLDSEVFGSEFCKTGFGIGLRTLKNINRDFSENLTFRVKVNGQRSSQRSTLTSSTDVSMTSAVSKSAVNRVDSASSRAGRLGSGENGPVQRRFRRVEAMVARNRQAMARRRPTGRSSDEPSNGVGTLTNRVGYVRLDLGNSKVATMLHTDIGRGRNRKRSMGVFSSKLRMALHAERRLGTASRGYRWTQGGTVVTMAGAVHSTPER
ncbi:hypothetical protein V6N12_014003 [Hibiscus sabdariffa]|uniref:Uncharacterized protein n=1 Tax=Hibiscus sabdariffa TaxID=183260 RepID=A0ABR2CXM9_9ROSI